MSVQSDRRNDSILARLIGIDRRALAFFRMALALCVLVDLGQRSTDLYAHYTDPGWLPRADVVRLFGWLHEWPLCIHLMSGSLEAQAALFLIHAAAAVALLLGYHTRAATFVVWLLLASVQLRNLLIGGGHDALMRMYTLWAFFLPLGGWLSLDNVRRRQTPAAAAPMVLSIGTVALLAQVVIVYWAAGYAKMAQDTWLEGTALRLIFHDHFFAKSLGGFVGQFPALCSLLSRATVVLELAGPALLIVSGVYAPLRVAVIAALCAMNVTFALTLDVGLFPWVMSIGTLTFLPPEFWDRVAAWRKLRRLRTRAAASALWQGLIAHARSTGAPAALLPASVQGPLLTGLCALLLAVVVAWNVGVARDRTYSAPWYTQPIVGPLFLQQDWRMFAAPSTRSGWIVIPARLASGREIDLMTAGGRVTTLRDHDGGTRIDMQTPRGLGVYANLRWRTALRNVVAATDERPTALLYGRFLCRDWNSRHGGDDELRTFQIIYMTAELKEPFERMDYQPGVVWTHDCFG